MCTVNMSTSNCLGEDFSSISLDGFEGIFTTFLNHIFKRRAEISNYVSLFRKQSSLKIFTS